MYVYNENACTRLLLLRLSLSLSLCDKIEQHRENELFKIQQQKEGVIQNPATEREDLLKIQQHRENELFKIQQDRENDVLKIQQERENELFKIQQKREKDLLKIQQQNFELRFYDIGVSRGQYGTTSTM